MIANFAEEMEKEHLQEPPNAVGVLKQYPTYQLSKFLSGSKDYQIVVRADSAEEFIAAMEEIKPFIVALEGSLSTTKSAVTPKNDVVARQHASEDGFCQLHQVQMQEKTGAYGPYFSHMIQDVGFCNGKKITPFKPKQ